MNTFTNPRRVIVAALVSLMMLSSCTTSKSLMKDGLEYQSGGMDSDAVNAFKASLSKKSENATSRKGLKESGQKVLTGKLDEFNRNAILKRPKEAVYGFMDAESFRKELKKYGVDLHIPEHYYSTYLNTEETYLSTRYEEGHELLMQDKFGEAKLVFREIMSIKPGYRDVESLNSTSVLEPKYRTALAYETSGDFRKAFYMFDEICHSSAYKDATVRRDDCRDKGTFVLAMMPFEDATGHPQNSARVQAYALDALSSLGNPFLRIVDRQNIDQVLNEQDFSLGGIVDDASAIEVGNLIGAEAILVGEVIDYRENMGRIIRTQKQGYESYIVKEKGEDGKVKEITRYKPVNYNVYTDRNSVYLSFHVKMISLETAEVLMSDIMEREYSDEVEYASYRGNANRLFSELNDRPNLSRTAVSDLRNLLNARTELANVAEISNQAFNTVGADLARKVESYLNQ